LAVTRAALWDMDGTLVDSEEYHWQAWHSTMADYGCEITREQFLASFGQRNDTILQQWLGSSATPQIVAKIEDEKENRFRTLVREKGISPLPGVNFWLHHLRERGWMQAVASAAPRLNVEVTLESLRFGDCFQAFVSAEDVKNGKPDPEVFLKAAAKLSVVPDNCVVLEDGRAGIEGARRAGMRSIGVNRNGMLREANIAVASLNDLGHDAFESLFSAN
jgi:HAD superfamily hydrolase (TIGR01509 family)